MNEQMTLSVLIEMRDRMSQAIDKATRGLDAGQAKALAFQKRLEQLERRAQSFARASRSMALGGAAIVGSLMIPTKMAASYEKGLARVATMTDLSLKDTKAKYGKAVQGLAADIGQNTSVVADAMYQALSASVPEEKVMGFLDVAGKAAVAGMTDLETSVDGMTSALNAYQMGAEKAGTVSDWMFTAVKAGKTTFDEIARSIGNVAPMASAMNVGMDELLAGMAAITKQGQSTSEAFTGLRGIIKAAMDPPEAAAKLYEELGVVFDSNAIKSKGFAGALGDVISSINEYTDDEAERQKILATLLGRVEAVNAALALSAGNGEDFNRIIGLMGDSAGATAEAFDKIADSASFKMDQAIQKVKNLATNIGTLLLPSVTDFFESVGDGLGPVMDWIASNQELAAAIATGALKLGAASTALGTLGWALGKVASPMLKLSSSAVKAGADVMAIAGGAGEAQTAVGAMLKFFMAHPVVLVVAGAVAALALVVTHWDKVKAAAKAVWDWLENSNLGKVISVCLAPVYIPLKLLVEHWDAVTGAAKKFASWLGFYDAEKDVWTIWEPFKKFFGWIDSTIGKLIDLWNKFMATFTRSAGDLERAAAKGDPGGRVKSQGNGNERARGHAEGGIFHRAQYGLFAEDGPEALIPLSGKHRTRGMELWERAGEMLGVFSGKSQESMGMSRIPAVSMPEFAMPDLSRLEPRSMPEIRLPEQSNGGGVSISFSPNVQITVGDGTPAIEVGEEVQRIMRDMRDELWHQYESVLYRERRLGY